MSRLHEHVVKAILAREGLMSPPGRLCRTPAEGVAAQETFGPVYVKAQLPMGDRSSVGAVIRCKSAEETREACVRLLAQRFPGELTASDLLVEQETPPLASYYFAVQIRDAGPARHLVFSRGGGAGFDPSCAELVLPLKAGAVDVEMIRAAFAKLGISNDELSLVCSFSSKVVQGAMTWGLYTLELNPVFRTAEGLVCIDAKAETDDYAAAAAPDPALLADPSEGARERKARDFQRNDYRGSLRYVQLVSEEAGSAERLVGTHSVGGGESLVVIDALSAAGVTAANYCDTSGSPSREKVAYAAELVSGQPHIQAMYFSTCIANQPLSVTANGLVDGWRRTGWRKTTVIRFAGNQETEALQIMRDWADAEGVKVVLMGRSEDEWSGAMALAQLMGRS